MSAALVTLVLALVFAASALNLLLGGLWVAAFVAVTLVRRWVRYGAWLVLVLALAAGVGAARAGWLAPPPVASYAADEVSWLRQRLARLGPLAGLARPPAAGSFASAAAALRARLEARRREEFRHTGRQLEQRAVAAIAVSRDVGRLRARAAAEVAAVEDAVRQLALTLTAPEFRDLEAREARLAGWFAELEARLAAARDQADLDAVSRALEPAALAGVSLRALREDLARAGAASAALIRTLTGGAGVAASAAWRVEYDERRGLLLEERRFRFEATPPLRITRLDAGALRPGTPGPGPAATVHTLAYTADGGEPRPIAGGAEIVPDGGAARIVLLERRERPAMSGAVGAPLRPVRFARLLVPGERGPAPDFPVRVLLGEGAGPEPLLVVEAGPPRGEGLTAPRSALHHVSRPGRVTTGPAADVWVPTGPDGAGEPGEVAVELVPGFLRNPVYARVRPYLYVPNLAVVLAATALAAVASICLRPRPRPAATPAPAAGSG